MFGQAVCAYLWNHLFGNALLCHEKAGNGRTTLSVLLLQDLSLSSSEFSNFEALRGAEWPVSVFFEVRPLIYKSLVSSSK